MRRGGTRRRPMFQIAVAGLGNGRSKPHPPQEIVKAKAGQAADFPDGTQRPQVNQSTSPAGFGPQLPEDAQVRSALLPPSLPPEVV